MSTLDRYIIRSFLVSALMCLLVLMSLRILSDLFLNLDEFTKQRRGQEDRTALVVAKDIGSYYGYRCLPYFRELGGIIIVAAAAFTLARMNHTNELTAILASGVSLHRVLLPICVCAVGLNLLVVLDSEVLIPQVKAELVRDRADPGGLDAMKIKIATDENDSVWYSRRFERLSEELADPMLMLRSKDYRYLGHLTAPSARYDWVEGAWEFTSDPPRAEQPKPSGKDKGKDAERSSKGKTGLTQAVLFLMGAAKAPTTEFLPADVGPQEILAEVMAKPGNQDVDWSKASIGDVDISFKTGQADVHLTAQRLDVQTVDGRAQGTVLYQPWFAINLGERQVVLAGDRATYGLQDNVPGWRLVNGRLLYKVGLTPAELALRQSQRWMQYMSSAELAQLMHVPQMADPAKAMLLRHCRFADFLNNIIMLLVAAPFILSRERNLKSSATLTVLMVGAFFVFIYFTRNVGLSPALSAWLPILSFGPVAVATVDSVKT
jgi:lipopolysaccharide export LptBFGC system permease protein LptF